MNLKYATLSYAFSANYGDEIQSIAAARCLPKGENTTIDRGRLNVFSSATKHILLMNGYFGLGKRGWDGFPPSEDIIPIYFSFHIAQKAAALYTSPECLEHFRKWQPIGCRDRGTAALLKNKGIDTFFAKCLTLTLEKRARSPANGKLFIVDGEDLPVPRSLKRTAEWVRQSPHPDDPLGHQAKLKRALMLLERYRDEANLVITKRMHCALPCLAMGVPVIFMTMRPPTDYRLNLYSDIGGTVHRLLPMTKLLRLSIGRLIHKLQVRHFSWQGDVLDLSDEKRKIRVALQQQIDRQLAKL